MEATATRLVERLRAADHEALFAGGCVRDRLLGKEAHDIDIAIDTMMGQDFTQHLVDYMKEAGRDQEVGSVGVIET